MKRTLLVLIVGLSSVAAAMATPISFPGKSTVAQSPAGQFSLVWFEANADQPHMLKLRLANGALRPVMSIERHATVQWAPSGNQFAVSDAFASNESRVLIYSVSEKEGATAIQLKLPKRVDRLLQANHHSYIEVIDWTQEGLKLNASGYGAAPDKSFCQNIVCTPVSSEALQCRENHDC
jgi:hypothetical protein